MLDLDRVFQALKNEGITLLTGVPDSYLNGFCTYALKAEGIRNVIAANEGNAVGIAAGHYVATRHPALVYMQNSGIGNAVNPLLSLADASVYSIPMLLLIGWRGQPGTHDWVQHRRQGELTTALLDALNIPYRVLDEDDDHFIRALREATTSSLRRRAPFALIAPKGVFDGKKVNDGPGDWPMDRKEAMATVLDVLPSDAIYVASTGRTTRELFFLREERHEPHDNDFLNIGAMGHASSIALGIALARPSRRVVIFDGDGANIMHMGAMTMMRKVTCPNLLHIVLNNGVHESVGGQPSAGQKVHFTEIAEACGYRTTGKNVQSAAELRAAIDQLSAGPGTAFIDCYVRTGLPEKLPPISFSPIEAVNALSDKLAREGAR